MKILVNNMANTAVVKDCRFITDPQHSLISEVGLPFAAAMLLENSTHAYVRLEDALLDRGPGFPCDWEYVDENTAIVFTDAGYIYIQSTLKELRSMSPKTDIYLRIECPKANKGTLMTLNPRTIGYGMPDQPLDQEIAFLVAMPDQVTPAVWEPVEIIQGKYLAQFDHTFRTKEVI